MAPIARIPRIEPAPMWAGSQRTCQSCNAGSPEYSHTRAGSLLPAEVYAVRRERGDGKAGADQTLGCPCSLWTKRPLPRGGAEAARHPLPRQPPDGILRRDVDRYRSASWARFGRPGTSAPFGATGRSNPAPRPRHRIHELFDRRLANCGCRLRRHAAAMAMNVCRS